MNLSPQNGGVRYVMCAMASLALCFLLQACVYYWFDGRSGKSESNYFSTLSRFQSSAHPAAEIALAGSSITGRLPGREMGNGDIANLGSDGSTAIDGVTLLIEGKIEKPRWLVVEINTMFGGLDVEDSTIVNGARGWWFGIGARYPLLGSSARPTAMLYSALLNRQKISAAPAFQVGSTAVNPAKSLNPDELSVQQRRRFALYEKYLSALHQEGVRILLVNYPPGFHRDKDHELVERSISELARRVPVTYADFSSQIPRDSIQFTDDIHMGSLSAAQVLGSIRELTSRL